MKKDILCRPFAAEQIKQRPGQQGKTVSYFDIATIIARLNEGCDAWNFGIVRHEILDEEVIVLGKLTADGIVKMAFGSSSITRDSTGRAVSIGDDLKSAASDATKKTASLLGVGLELYGGTSAPAKQAAAHAEDAQRRAPQPEERLTSRQLGAIHGACRRHNVSRGHLATMLHQRSGKERVEHLTKREASDLLSELAGLNGHG